MKKIFRIIIIGPQSSGKGTQADLLSEKLHLPIISVGNIIRGEIKKKTLIGKKAENYVSRGCLIPDELTNRLVEKIIKKNHQGFILDGFPRDLNQAKFLSLITRPTHLIEITLTNSEAIKRIAGRLSCSCGEVYHLKYKPPKKKGKCDECGKILFIREDDQPQAIKKRLKIYRQNLNELEKFYRSDKIIIKIDGRPSIKKINNSILKKLNEHHKKPDRN